MERAGIAGIGDHDISQVSGGQLQRAGICRALINEPGIVFGGRPTGALDSVSASGILDLLDDVNRAGKAIFLVTHDARVAARCERVLYMADGRIVDEIKLGRRGPGAEEIVRREKALTSWLTELAV